MRKLLRRPLTAAAVIYMILLLILNALHLPPGIRLKGDRIADGYFEQHSGESIEAVITGTVSESSEKDSYSVMVLKQVTAVFTAENSRQSYRISRVRLTVSDTVCFPVGTLLCGTGELEKPPSPTNPGQFDSALYAKTQHIGYVMKNPVLSVRSRRTDPVGNALGNLRQALCSRMEQVYSKADAGVLSAMLLGDRQQMDQDDRIRWQLGGIAHMLAISGLHLTLIGSGLSILLRRMRVPPRCAAVLSAGLMVCYVLMTGITVSNLRACLMFILGVFAGPAGRSYDMMTSLSAAVLLILIENPWNLFYSGFQMSACAVLILCIFRKRSKLTVSVMLYLGMLPIVLSSYYEMPLYSILLNALVIPLLPFLLVSGLIGCLIGIPTAGIPASLILKLIRLLLHISTSFPYSSLILGKPSLIQIVIYEILLAGWALLMKKYRNYKRKLFFWLLVPLLVAVLGFHSTRELNMTFLDVGQGDSCLIRCPGGGSCLIDGGSTGVSEVGRYRILPAVKSSGIRSLDYVILTHMDADHINGVCEILEMIRDGQTSLRIKTVIMPYLVKPDQTYLEVRQLAKDAGCRTVAVREGDRIQIGDVSVLFLNPDPGLKVTTGTEENSSSIAAAFYYRSFRALLAGDIEGSGEQNVMENIRKLPEQHFYVLKVSHHGSSYSTPEEFLDLVKPDISIISAGKHNRYNHPGQQLLNRLQQVHSAIYRTDKTGAVILRTDGRKCSIETFNFP